MLRVKQKISTNSFNILVDNTFEQGMIANLSERTLILIVFLKALRRHNFQLGLWGSSEIPIVSLSTSDCCLTHGQVQVLSGSQY